MSVDDDGVQQRIHQMHQQAEQIPVGIDAEALRAKASRHRLPLPDITVLSMILGVAALVLVGVLFTTASKPTSARPKPTVSATTTTAVPSTTIPLGGVPATTTPATRPPEGSQRGMGGVTPSTTPSATQTTITPPTTTPSSTTSTTEVATGSAGPSAEVVSVSPATTASGSPAENVTFSVSSPTSPFSCTVEVSVHNGDEVGNGTTSTITPDPAESSMIETLLVPVSGSSFAGYPFTANVVCTYQSTP